MNNLTETLEDFTWDNYKDISDAVVRFDEHSIDESLIQQASIYSYYYGLMSAAKKQMNEKTFQLTQFASKLRKAAKFESSKKLTAKDLDDLVFSEDQYQARQSLLDDATFKYELLKGLVRALEQKKDMLQQVSANKREETKLYK